MINASDEQSKDSMEKIFIASKSIFFCSLSGLLITLCYLLIQNPNFNYVQKIWLEEKSNLQEKADYMPFKVWKYDLQSDVDAKDERYPIVVLRTGFKVLSVDEENAWVGWKYEMLNTSPENDYTADINFTLLDEDQFELASGSQSQLVESNYGAIAKGKIKIQRSELKRLNSSSWTIFLGNTWSEQEKNVKEKRYQRSSKIMLDRYAPDWISSILEDEQSLEHPKWKVLKTALDEALLTRQKGITK